MSPARRVAALFAASAVLALTSPGTALADPEASATPSPSCTLTCLPSPEPSATGTPTPSPTPKVTHSPTPKPTPSPTRVRRTASPTPRATTAAPTLSPTPVETTAEPVLTETPTPTPTPVKAKPAAKESGSAKLARIGWIVIGGALLLGIGGGAGLYLTRHQA